MGREEKWFVAVIVIVFVVAFLAFSHAHDVFEQACDEAGGKTVWDGRQYQCLGAKKEAGNVK